MIVAYIFGDKTLLQNTKGIIPEKLWEQLSSKFNLIILGELNAKELGAKHADNVVSFVENGGSLIVLGTQKTLGPNGYSSTSLKALLPIVFKDVLYHEEGRFKMGFNDLQKTNGFNPFSNFSEPPELLSFYHGSSTQKKNITVIASILNLNKNYPVIVAGQHGKGRVIMILTDPIWKWKLSKDNGEEMYNFFWQEMLLYLIK
ncbi:glutamine amidotransferase, partial [Verrucomicrobiota bacterium]